MGLLSHVPLMALPNVCSDAVRRDWADRLDCDPAAFETAGVTVTERPGRTVRLLHRGDGTVVAAPSLVSRALQAHQESLGEQPLPETGDAIREALAEDSIEFAEVHGPTVLSYVDIRAFSPVLSEARLLDAEDEDAFEELRARIPNHEWNRASPTFRSERTAGRYRDGELVAVATLGDSPFPDVGVVVEPAWRGKGLGRQVVSRVVSAAFEQDRDAVVRYRTPASASASLALATSLGFERWASELVVVLN